MQKYFKFTSYTEETRSKLQHPISSHVVEIQCPKDWTMKHGEETPSRDAYDVGTRVDFQCDSGYIAEGASSIACLEDGTWDDLAPNCQPSRCTMLPM